MPGRSSEKVSNTRPARGSNASGKNEDFKRNIKPIGLLFQKL